MQYYLVRNPTDNFTDVVKLNGLIFEIEPENFSGSKIGYVYALTVVRHCQPHRMNNMAARWRLSGDDVGDLLRECCFRLQVPVATDGTNELDAGGSGHTKRTNSGSAGALAQPAVNRTTRDVATAIPGFSRIPVLVVKSMRLSDGSFYS